jgi:hypothetical protein
MQVGHAGEVVETGALSESDVLPALQPGAAVQEQDPIVETGQSGFAPLRQLWQRHGGAGEAATDWPACPFAVDV